MGNDKRLGDIINELTATEEHFLKKYLLENRLTQELHYLSSPQICQWLGPPFKKSGKMSEGDEQLPLLLFFFQNLVTKFPFIASNSAEEQTKFWQATVQPFVESMNSKRSDKHEMIPKTKRKRYINKKMLSGLLIFYNSMIVTQKDMKYLEESHLKSTQSSKLENLQKSTAGDALNISLNDYAHMKFSNNINVNIVAVRRMVSPATSSSGWFGITTRGPRHNYEFVLQVTTRLKHGIDYTYKSHFIARPFSQFRKLEKGLKALLPGVMSTKIFPIGHKLKNDNGSSADLDDSSTIVSNSKDNKLFREKQRLALRGWISALLEYPEIIHSNIFQNFIDDDSINFDSLSPDDLIDHENRIAHERHIIKTQQEFQTQTVHIISNLSAEFEHLKSQLVKNPKALNDFYDILGKTRDVEKSQSSLIRSFNDWCKIEIAATLYQWFLGSDRAAPVLAKCVKLNRLVPHGLIYNVLRFTNPVKIVSRMLDLLFLPLPSFSMPRWSSSSQDELAETKKKEARNMISIAFVMLLEDDLSNYEKELKVLEESLPEGFIIFTQRIKAYFELPHEICQEIQDESDFKSQDLLLTVLSTDLISPRLSGDIDKIYFDDIASSYESYQNLGDSDVEDIELYVALKQYWQLKINTKDKEFFKLLWQDPETTKFIKGALVIFYKPLLELMNKAQMHVAYRDTQIFMEDVLKEMVNLNNGEKYYLDPMTLLNRIVSIVTKHENRAWSFINNIYSNDERELFKGLITWISKFLEILRIKYTDLSLVDLKLNEMDVIVDNELFIKQLTSRTKKIVAKRQLFKQYLQAKTELSSHTTQEKIDYEWENIHENIMGDNNGVAEFGVDIEDLEEFNNMNNEQDFDSEEVGALERQLRQDLYKLEHESDCGTSELDKLDNAVKNQLITIFQRLEMEK